MYNIEKKDYGFKLIFADSIKVEEMNAWVEESKKVLASAPSKFGVFVDMRTLKPLVPEAQAEMQNGQKLFKQKGMERSVVIVASAVLKMQFQRIAKETGIYDWERYIDSSSTADWERIGIAWLTEGKDPDQ